MEDAIWLETVLLRLSLKSNSGLSRISDGQGLGGNKRNCAVLLPYLLHHHTTACCSTASSSSSQVKSRPHICAFLLISGDIGLTDVPPSIAPAHLSSATISAHLLSTSHPPASPLPSLLPFLSSHLGLGSKFSTFLKRYQVPQPLQLLPSLDLGCPRALDSSPCPSPCRSPLLQKVTVLLYRYSQCFQYH